MFYKGEENLGWMTAFAIVSWMLADAGKIINERAKQTICVMKPIDMIGILP